MGAGLGGGSREVELELRMELEELREKVERERKATREEQQLMSSTFHEILCLQPTSTKFYASLFNADNITVEPSVSTKWPPQLAHWGSRALHDPIHQISLSLFLFFSFDVDKFIRLCLEQGANGICVYNLGCGITNFSLSTNMCCVRRAEKTLCF